MKVLVTGASGLVGSALTPLLSAGGHQPVPLSRGRSSARSGQGWWDPATGEVDPDALAGAEAFVHLAGENIASGRWTARHKRAIRDSRVGPTSRLAETLAMCPTRPCVFVAASAIGFYGNRGDTALTEKDAPGDGFLPDVCREWEAATGPLEAAGVRVVHLRTGIVLSPRGGALAKMLVPFKLGTGGVIGAGTQYMSWIGLDDLVGLIGHALAAGSLRGAVNATSPNPVTNREFTETLGRVLGRPTPVPVPAFAARLAFGEMADALLLASARVLPERALASGYRFRHERLEEALRHLLDR